MVQLAPGLRVKPARLFSGHAPYYFSTCARVGCTRGPMVTDPATPEPEPKSDQVTQAVTVGVCLALATVLVVLALV